MYDFSKLPSDFQLGTIGRFSGWKVPEDITKDIYGFDTIESYWSDGEDNIEESLWNNNSIQNKFDSIADMSIDFSESPNKHEFVPESPLNSPISGSPLSSPYQSPVIENDSPMPDLGNNISFESPAPLDYGLNDSLPKKLSFSPQSELKVEIGNVDDYDQPSDLEAESSESSESNQNIIQQQESSEEEEKPKKSAQRIKQKQQIKKRTTKNKIVVKKKPAQRIHLEREQKRKFVEDDNGRIVRRSTRIKFEPLDYWRGEQPVYGRRESGSFSVVDVIKVPEVQIVSSKQNKKQSRERENLKSKKNLNLKQKKDKYVKKEKKLKKSSKQYR